MWCCDLNKLEGNRIKMEFEKHLGGNNFWYCNFVVQFEIFEHFRLKSLKCLIMFLKFFIKFKNFELPT